MWELILLRIKNRLQYVGDMSDLHGIKYLFSKRRISKPKRFFWLIILSICCYGAGSVLRSSLKLLSSDVISYSVDTNYLDWDTPFPAVTVCEQMDTNRIKSYLKKHDLPISLSGFYKEVSFWNMKYCRTCTWCELNKTCVEDFVEHVKRIRLNCSNLLSDCWWNDRYFPCCERFHPIQTEYGVCFTFNSALSDKSRVLIVNKKIGTPRLVFTTIDSSMIRIHASDEMISVDMENILGNTNVLPLMANLEAILKVEQTVSDVSVSLISKYLRSCLFRDEKPFVDHWPFKKYTYSACILYCRAFSQYNYCNCSHHFLADMVKLPTCDVQGLACLSINKDDILKFNCSCPMGCEETSYKVTHVFYNRSSKTSDTIRTSRSTVRIAQLPTMRIRRFAIRDYLGLVVDIGGVGGVFFGASLLSVIEFVYLFCIRRK